MNESNESMQDDQSASIPQNPDVAQDEKVFDRAAMEESVKIRLKKERIKTEEAEKKAERISKELEDLKRKFESGKATSNESSEYMAAQNKINESVQQGIDPKDLPEIIDHHIKITKLNQSLVDAREKDPELKALLMDPKSPEKISREELDSFAYLPNPAAVYKHLMMNDQDRMVLKAAEQAYANGDGGVAYYTCLNNLSGKLKDTAVYPHPPSFKPAPSLTDIGEAGEFDSESYIKNKYGKGAK